MIALSYFLFPYIRVAKNKHMKYNKIDPKLFTLNRERFVKKMKSNAIAIFHAHPILPENGDAIYHQKPNSEIVWLSGIVQEKTLVVLYPDNVDKTYREVLVNSSSE